MLLFRFRSPSELAFKELLYSELYFASQDELNDPFDGESYYEFNQSEVFWENLLKQVASHSDSLFNKTLPIAKLANTLSKIPSLNYSQVVNGSFKNVLDIIPLAIPEADETLLKILAIKVEEYLLSYQPSKGYFVSFSKPSQDTYLKIDPLMWAHYAAQHTGFSLIFRSINGKIWQHPSKTKLKTHPSGFVQSSVPEQFQFHKVNYEASSEHQDASMLLPSHLFPGMKEPTSEEIVTHHLKHQQFLLTKHTSWKYEQEYRLLINQSARWLNGQDTSLTPLDRLFYYNPMQLVGVVFGSRMTEPHIQRIKEIIQKIKAEVLNCTGASPNYLFPFAYFKARMSAEKREINTQLDEIYDHSFSLCNYPKRDTTITQWLKGHAILLENGSSKQVEVK